MGDSGAKNHIITHTDLSRGTTLSVEPAVLGTILSDANRLEFLQELARGMKYGGNACINELAPTDVRTLFVDMDMTIGNDNKEGGNLLRAVDLRVHCQECGLPDHGRVFPHNVAAGRTLKFAIACPNKLRYKGGGKKFGAHIRCLQTRDHYGNCVGVYLHVDNMAYFRRSLVYKLCELYPARRVRHRLGQGGGLGTDPEWRDADDRHAKVEDEVHQVQNADPEEKEFCDCDSGFVYDNTVYEMSSVLSTDGSLTTPV